MVSVESVKITTPTMVPQRLTLPGVIVVKPRNAPTAAGTTNSRPTEAWPMRSLDASNTPGIAVNRPEVTQAPATTFRVGMPFNSAAL